MEFTASINKFLKRIALSSLSIYRKGISPFLPHHCRYIPTCSEYAHDAITVYGVLKGMGFIIKRLSRCHPWGGSGFDPLSKK